MKAFRYTAEMADRYTRQGWWGGPTFLDHMERNAREIPDKVALVDSQASMTFAQVTGPQAIAGEYIVKFKKQQVSVAD